MVLCQIHLFQNFGDTRYGDVTIIRPMRYVFGKKFPVIVKNDDPRMLILYILYKKRGEKGCKISLKCIF